MKRKDLCLNCHHFFYQHGKGGCHADCFRDDGESEICECPEFISYEEE